MPSRNVPLSVGNIRQLAKDLKEFSRRLKDDIKVDIEQRTCAAIAEDVRQGLGESLFSIQKRNRPLPEVTTPSMAALKAYSEGATLWYTGRYQEAVQLYESAVEQDPDFAMAHEALAVAYYSYIYNDVVRGKQHCDRSLALGNRTTEHERMTLKFSARQQTYIRKRTKVMKTVLSEYPQIKLIEEHITYIPGQIEDSKKWMTNFLTGHPNFKGAVWCAWDEPAAAVTLAGERLGGEEAGTGGATSPSYAPVLDIAGSLEDFADDAESYQELLNDFIGSLPARLDKMLQAQQDGDIERLGIHLAV